MTQDSSVNRKTPFTRWRLRTVVRCVALVALAVTLLAPLPWRGAPQVATGASPFVGIAASLATRSLSAASFAWIVVLAVAMVRRRWFCRWACPVGLMTECAGRISPVSATRCKPVPRLGIWLVLLSFSAAAVGYPLFVWLDPLAMFGGTLGLAVDPAAAAARAAAALLAAVVLLSYVLPGTWCLKLCPLGAAQELAANPRLAIERRLAAADAAQEDSAANDELIADPLNRRSLFTMGVGAACAVAGVPLGLAMKETTLAGERKTLRPPGAAPEWQFGQLCLRCGNCVRACPTRIITTRLHSNAWSTWLAPEIAFNGDHCHKDCTACMNVCPSGALSRPSPEVAAKPAIGLAHLDMERCLLALGSECRTMCLDACSYEAITLHEWTWEDDRRYPIVAPDKCVGCGACQVACTPMHALVVRIPVTQ